MNVNPIDEYDHNHLQATETVDYTDPRLVRVTRVRYISDPGFPAWDLSYAYGFLDTGEYVRIRVPSEAYQLPKKRAASALIRLWPNLPKLVPDGYVNNVLSLCQ